MLPVSVQRRSDVAVVRPGGVEKGRYRGRRIVLPGLDSGYRIHRGQKGRGPGHIDVISQERNEALLKQGKIGDIYLQLLNLSGRRVDGAVSVLGNRNRRVK